MNGGRPIIDIDELRAFAAAPFPQHELAEMFGVTQAAISQAIRKHNLRPIKKRHADHLRRDRHQ